MFHNSIKRLSVVAVLVLCQQGVSTGQTAVCQQQQQQGGGLLVECSCPHPSGIMIVKDSEVIYEETSISLPNNTHHLVLAQCGQLHLSGQTLTLLHSIHTLQLRHIATIHTAYDFLAQFSTSLQVLEVDSCHFAQLEDSFNIEAQAFKRLSLHNITWPSLLNILIQTHESQAMQAIHITHSTIHQLGEINIYPRTMEQLVLVNNTIRNILNGAIMVDAAEVTLADNTLGQLSFLCLESHAHNFTLAGNTITNLTLDSLQVNNATYLNLLNNSFYHIERHALLWLHARNRAGIFTFSGNHLYNHEVGSLVFYFTVFNDNLVVSDNVFHAATCDCSTTQLVENMTESSDIQLMGFKYQREEMYNMFVRSSYCMDQEGKNANLSQLCESPELTQGEVQWQMIVAVVLTVLLCVVVVYVVVRKLIVRHRYKELLLENEINMTYVVDEESEYD